MATPTNSISIADVIAQFLIKRLTPITGRPDWFGISTCIRELRSNARQIESPNGCGNRGHLRVCYSLAAYNAIPAVAGTPWVDPVNPGLVANIPNGATSATIGRLTYEHNSRRNAYLLQRAVDKALLKLLMEAVEPTYYKALNDSEHGYADIRLIDLMDHLTTNYGTVTEDMLTQNEKNMKLPWNPTTPLEHLWKQLRNAKAFAEHHDPITDRALVRAATNNLEQSGVFYSALRKWREKARADQTWANCQTHFNTANVERLRSKTAGEYANNVTATNAANVDKLYGQGSTDTILAAILSGKNHPLLNKENMPTPMYYCWTHGLGHDPGHTGYTCTEPQKGHKKEATQFNMMGGCNIIKRLKSERRVWKNPYWKNKENDKNGTNGTNGNGNANGTTGNS